MVSPSWIRQFALPFALSSLPVTAALAHQPAPFNPPPVYDLITRSLAISPDGRRAMFAKYRWGTGAEEAELWLADLATGFAVRLGATPVTPPRTINAAWSPNGRYVAFYGEVGSTARLLVLDVMTRRIVAQSNRDLCSVPTCQFWSPVWSANSRVVVFVANPAGRKDPLLAGASTRTDPITPMRLLEDELTGRTPSATGVTVMASPGLSPNAAMNAPTQTAHARHLPTDLVALDVISRQSLVLARKKAFVGVLGARQTSHAVAAVSDDLLPGDRSAVFSYFAFNVPAKIDPARSAEAPALTRVAQRVHAAQVGNAASLDPTGRFLAFTTTGPNASGDVMVAPVDGSEIRNLTRNFEPPPNPLDSASPIDVPHRSLWWHGKFGSAFVAPIWSRAGDAIFVLRGMSRSSDSTEPASVGVELWRISLAGGAVARVPVDRDITIESLALCADVHAPCLAGPRGRLIAIVRHLEANLRELAEIDVEDGSVHSLEVLGDAGPAAGVRACDLAAAEARFIVAPGAGVAVGVQENRQRPPGLFVVRQGARASFHRFGRLNRASLRPLVTAHDLEWPSGDGRDLHALLLTPVAPLAGPFPPVIEVVYGSRFGSRDGGRFDGGDEWFRPLESRYAILLPDLPAPLTVNSGHGCDGYAENALAALAAARTAHLADADRAAVVGHSWGGYTAACIISRTQRFRAAVSINGVSDLSTDGLKGAGLGAYAGYLNLKIWPWEDPKLFASESPITRIGQIVTPLLLVRGKRDVTPFTQDYDLFIGLKNAGRQVASISYDESAHNDVLTYPDFWRRIGRWLEHYLGGSPGAPVQPADLTVPVEAGRKQTEERRRSGR